MRTYTAILAIVLTFFLAASCSKEDTGKVETSDTAPTITGSEELPSGHPMVGGAGTVEDLITGGHAESKAVKELKISDEVKAKWPVVTIEVLDNSTGSTQELTIKVGEVTKLNDTGFTVKAEAFLPDYAIFEDHIGSRSNDSNNPAVLVDLAKGGSSVARGWVFGRLPDFNSYDHDRFAVSLVKPAPVVQEPAASGN